MLKRVCQGSQRCQHLNDALIVLSGFIQTYRFSVAFVCEIRRVTDHFARASNSHAMLRALVLQEYPVRQNQLAATRRVRQILVMDILTWSVIPHKHLQVLFAVTSVPLFVLVYVKEVCVYTDTLFHPQCTLLTDSIPENYDIQ